MSDYTLANEMYQLGMDCPSHRGLSLASTTPSVSIMRSPAQHSTRRRRSSIHCITTCMYAVILWYQMPSNRNA